MRLFELTGYKGHPAYQAGKALKPHSGKGMSGHTFDKGSMNELRDTLLKLGWYRVGKGSFASVFRHANYPWVVKVFFDDDAYAEYFQIMKANQSNPHVPKVRGNLIKLNDKAYAVRLEELKELNGEHDPVFRSYVDPELEPVFQNVFDNPNNQPFLEENHPQLVELVSTIFSNVEGWNDLTIKNVMKRGNTLVLSDPIGR